VGRFPLVVFHVEAGQADHRAEGVNNRGKEYPPIRKPDQENGFVAQEAEPGFHQADHEEGGGHPKTNRIRKAVQLPPETGARSA
jgi:hypothetical protein